MNRNRCIIIADKKRIRYAYGRLEADLWVNHRKMFFCPLVGIMIGFCWIPYSNIHTYSFKRYFGSV